ncbi:PAS domain S-box-containing protein [Flavobacterium sp. CG_23.5]|uniref:PAS domain S-box protein n=1 Tax=unclassified Flavobacterium TaxID=196869 RepID=UPI0018CB29EC|nr:MULTISPECIES: PAS domain S-box protein [unclassified Flavobacterium]MBG6112105.1 PAS domain S-box-containing protein [Flavobacterium sp. CG_9.10]MBP2282784.1 PAS domain S-box-containing protein [Flavobacterium sp. CG_23.5]
MDKKNQGKAHHTEPLSMDAIELTFQGLISQAPVAITTFLGPTFILQTVNKTALEIWGKTQEEVLHKTLLEISPELEVGLKQIFDQVYSTGNQFISNEILLQVNRNGKIENGYFNSIYQALRDLNNKIYGITVVTTEVTDSVNARKQIEESEKLLSNILSQSLMAIAIFKGSEMVLEFANDSMFNVLGKGTTILNKPLLEGVPELKDQVFPQLLAGVYATGVPFEASETKTILVRNGIPVDAYFNFIYQPYKDFDETITGITVFAFEVTEQVLAKKQIEANEEFNRTILESSPDCLKVLDMEGRIQFMNFNGLCQMEIDDFSTVKNTNWFTLWGSENEALVKASVDKALTGETANFTAFCPTVKGTPKWWDVVLSPIGKPGEPVQQLISVSRDITEKKKSEEALEKMATHLKLSTDSANVGTWSLDIKTQKLEWSALHKKMWGYDEKQEDLEYVDWYKIIVNEDKENTFRKVEEARTNHSIYEVEYRIERANDKVIRWMKAVGRYHYNEAGESITLTGISLDITEQKEAEEKIAESENQFRTFANSIQNLAWIASGDGWIYWYNQRWHDYTGTTLEEMQGWGWEKVHHPDYVNKVVEFIKEAWKKGEAWELTFPLRRHDGKYYWFLTRAYPVKDAKGNIERWIGTNTDIDEQKRFSEELTEANAKAETALYSKQQFLANMSHEIRTPMTAIVGFTKVLLKSDLSVKQKEYVKAIKTSGDALIVLINDILDLAKVDTGKMTFEETPFKMDLLISNIILLFELKSQEKNLALIEEYDKNIPELLLGDAVRLQQIILNLLSNALKFTTKGKINIMVRLLKEDEENVTIDFAITDTGIGIPEDKIESIFENFQQATSSTSRIYGGTGLGLAICKQLVEKQGGTISVKSKVNEGSSFSFSLTFKKALTAIKLTDTEDILYSEIKDIKVLVVEDVKLNQMLMRIILDDFQFKHDIADNGKIAIEKMQTEIYDIILMDLQMPVMDGFATTEYIRNTLNSNIPIIALTADVTTVDLEKCKLAGMNDYISKPLDERILYSKIVSLLKTK